jgi:hypothetical protein
MMKQRLIYFASTAAVAGAVLLALEQLARAHKRGQMPHIVNNALLLAGGVLAMLMGGLIIYAFTSTLIPLVIFASIVTLVLGAVRVWRFKSDREAEARWEALLAEEELQAGETAERDPANAAAWARLAQLKEKRGDLRGALELLNVACKLEPTQLNLDKLSTLQEKIDALPPGPGKAAN